MEITTTVPRQKDGVLELPAITLWQPWATLLVRGLKAFETRDWPHPWRDAPKVVAIHAAKRQPPTEAVCAALDAVDDLDLVKGLTGPHALGAIVGLVVFDRPRQMREAGSGVWCPQGSNERALGGWSPGRYGWLALASCAFGTPPRASGHQRTWTWKVPTSIADSVERAAERLAKCADERLRDDDWRWVECSWPSSPPWDIDRSEFNPFLRREKAQ